MRLTEHLVKSLHDSAIFNSEVQVAPACILWPDKDRHWEAVIPRLQNELKACCTGLRSLYWRRERDSNPWMV